ARTPPPRPPETPVVGRVSPRRCRGARHLRRARLPGLQCRVHHQHPGDPGPGAAGTRTLTTHPSPRPARYRHRSPGPQRLRGKRFMTPSDVTRLDAQLHGLHLHYIQSHYQALATKAAEQQRSHLDYLEQLVEGEATMRENRSIERRIKNARFPVLKSLDDFQWNWP